MKLEKREPLDLSVVGQSPDGMSDLTAEPDNDLDVPDFAMASAPENLGPLTRPAQDLTPSPDTPSPAALRTQARFQANQAPQFGRALYWAAFVASVLWAALTVYAVGYQWSAGVAEFQPYQTAVFVVLAVVPIGFFWIAAYCVRQGARLAAEVVRTKAIAEDMLEPAAMAAAETGSAVEAVRIEIQAAAAAAASARAEMLNLRHVLADETEKLAVSAEGSTRAAHALADKMSHEREAMSGLAASLDSRALAVTEAITRQAQMVAEASDLAQTQIGEAEAALAARATDLAAAAGDAGEAARLASEDLSRQVARLETATIGVSDQIRTMEDTLTQQRAALVTIAHTVRADHEDFSAKAETQRAQLADVLANAQIGVADLNESAIIAAQSLSELGVAAAEHAKELADTAKTERDLLAAGALQSLGALSEASRFERETLEADVDHGLQAIAGAASRERGALEDSIRTQLTALAEVAQTEREALEHDALRGLDIMAQAAETASNMTENHSEAARKKLEELSEAAFAASQQAEAAFQARLNDASELIARSASLIDQAAVKTAERIEMAAESARATLSQIEAAVEHFENRVDALPAQTQVQVETLRSSLARSFDGLLSSARAAAEETQAIDSAFQERVRRNYEMLSEAVRLMGVVSGRPGSASAAAAALHAQQRVAAPPPPTYTPPSRAEAFQRPEPTPPTSRSDDAPLSALSRLLREAEPPPAPPPARPSAAAAPARAAAPTPTPTPAPAASPSPVPTGLRPRLKLSPTTADTEVSSVFEAAAEPAAAQADGADWTWQELLSSMNDAPVEDRQLVDRLIGEIEALGVDLAAMLPPPRIDEIAAVLEAGDRAGARTVVRHLAPAAVRRLSRRAMAEKPLRAHAEGYVRRYTSAIEDALDQKGPNGAAISALLSTEEGRAFLLFDAALAELP